MSCLFSIKYEGSKDELVTRLRVAIIEANGEFDGDMKKGAFKVATPLGSFKARYTIDGEITIIVDEKPFVIGCSRIEREVHAYLGINEEI